MSAPPGDSSRGRSPRCSGALPRGRRHEPATGEHQHLHASGRDSTSWTEASRSEILAELRDGLLEAAHTNEQAGLDRFQAARLALEQFGDPQMLARAFCPELVLARARRTALALFAAAPTVAGLWIAAARSRGMRDAGRLFDSPTDHITAAVLIGAAVACGLWTLATTGRATRWLDLGTRAPLLGAAAMGAITIVADLATLSCWPRAWSAFQEAFTSSRSRRRSPPAAPAS